MVEPLPVEFGKRLDTVERAREWLTNPHNWHESNMMILRWDGNLCTVCRRHGERLIREPWDNGLPEVVVREQMRLKSGGKAEKYDFENSQISE